jgi:hypothetical protein
MPLRSVVSYLLRILSAEQAMTSERTPLPYWFFSSCRRPILQDPNFSIVSGLNWRLAHP